MEKGTDKKNNFKVAFEEIIRGKANSYSNDQNEEKPFEQFKEVEYVIPVTDQKVNDMKIDYKPNSSSDNTIISEGTIIDGSIKTKANLIIRGDVNGDVESEKDIEIAGNITGNVKGNSTIFVKGTINGNVSGHKMLTLIKESKITGDINGQEFECDGSVIGNITAANSVYLGSNSVVKGNIISKSISVKDGAQIKGSMEIL